MKYSKYFLVYHPNLVEDTAGEDVGRGRARGRNFLVYHRDLVGVTCGCVRKRRMRIRRENAGKKGEAELKGWREDGGGKGGMERGGEGERKGRSVHYVCSFKLHATWEFQSQIFVSNSVHCNSYTHAHIHTQPDYKSVSMTRRRRYEWRL